MPDFPHFDLPFRFEGGQLAVVEQDGRADIENKIETLVRCPLGFRDELPEFGWPRLEFGTAPLDVSHGQALLDEWVPDARAVLTEHGSSVEEAVRTITVNMNPEG